MPKKIALACQGGGSHTAFTAGALKTLLQNIGDSYTITGISGTSGGAMCAVLAWYGLLLKDPKKGAELLDGFWTANAAIDFFDASSNAYLVYISRYLAIPQLPDPTSMLFSSIGQGRLVDILESLIPFAELPKLIKKDSPLLLIGAVNILTGEFTVFKDKPVTPELLLASAAIPPLFKAVPIDGGLYWDGLFSQNPPIKEFISNIPRKEDRPDEIWLIQINPEQHEREPLTTQEVEDRRNELSGNLSINQELGFIETVNEWLAKGWLPQEQFKPITIRTLALNQDLDVASKLDRSPSFLRNLIETGEREAASFLKAFHKDVGIVQERRRA